METTIISYSLSGNNENLAGSLAKTLGARHGRITEAKPRTMGTIFLDLLFNRTPDVSLPTTEIGDDDLVLFVGPVWIGQIASPFRACFKQLRQRTGDYAFVSISGGADGPNLKLSAELKKRLGKEPTALVDLHIADLLPREPKPARKDTSAYRINEADLRRLTAAAEDALKKTFPAPLKA